MHNKWHISNRNRILNPVGIFAIYKKTDYFRCVNLTTKICALTFISVRLDKIKLIELGLNDRQIKAIEYLKENIKITNSEYQKLNSVSKATATRDLMELFDKYKLKRKEKQE